MPERRGACTNVMYVERKNAKSVKTLLETNGLLNKDFRMTSVDVEATSENNENVMESPSRYIAIPIHEALLEENTTVNVSEMVVARGMQFCPYSSAMLGNHGRHISSEKIERDAMARQENKRAKQLTRIQNALLEALLSVQGDSSKQLDAYKPDTQTLIESIMSLDVSVCPKKLELLGDDRTLVIPRRAFSIHNDAFMSLLSKLGQQCINHTATVQDQDSSIWVDSIMSVIWKHLAQIHDSPRVVRRGDIDPDSPIRESGHVILWPLTLTQNQQERGPNSPGWITVTEQGIQQSFDLTRVMFSRGNITEKIRFGKTLVQEGDVVLDMYAGIGYYMLPALIHGKARHVVACEWNPHAAFALEYNLQQNGIAKESYTVLVGDCRQLAREHKLANRFDRVSLGLLPSSQGGWKTAVMALRNNVGGWLHVHGNAPDVELTTWQQWLCRCLYSLAREQDMPNTERHDWMVLCTHVERVKSFSPRIHHYVADVWLGPATSEVPSKFYVPNDRRVGMLRDGEYVPCPDEVKPPSCALSSTGVLNQRWMMDTEQ